MELSHNWLTEGWIDFEYKKYILLNYLNQINEKFYKQKLYPFISQIMNHYQQLIHIKENKSSLQQQFPQKAVGINFQKLALTYETLLKDDEKMDEIEQIIRYAIPQMHHTIQQGKNLYNKVEKSLWIFPVGVNTLYEKEGVLFLQPLKQKVKIYRYVMGQVLKEDQHKKEPYISVYFEYICTEKPSYTEVLEETKRKFLKKYSGLRYSSVFGAVSKKYYPVEETLLPITKRMLAQHIMSTAT